MHFAFALDESGRVQERLRQACRSAWGDVELRKCGDFFLAAQHATASTGLIVDDAVAGAMSGWIRHDGLPPVDDDPSSHLAHTRALVRALADGIWPLDDGWTGQFAAAVFDRSSSCLVLSNDAFGYVPMYVAESGGAVLGGTSLVVLGRAGFNQPDALGVAQRISRAVSNFAGRTVLRNVQRLLPGERRTYRGAGSAAVQTFDDTFCTALIDRPLRSVAEEAWDRYKRETKAALGSRRRAWVALSGGWDSRLVLAAASGAAEIRCVTYGADHLYETRIAKRVAAAAGCDCEAYPLGGRYFPNRDRFRQLVAEVENAHLLQWLPVLDTAAPASGTMRDLMLLGDYWDTLDARRLYGLSSRSARARMTLAGLAGVAPPFSPSTPASFSHWKDARTADVLALVRRARADLSDDLQVDFSDAELENQLRADLATDFARVQANWPPFSTQFEHLFWWFHRSRYYIGGQGLTLSGAYDTAVPGASFRFARFASNIHPRLLIRRRLLDAIGRLPELRPFARIPSATIPWVSLRAPLAVREGVWAFRWAADAWLSSRLLRTQDPRARQWLLPTEDYLSEYRRPESIDRVASWFSGRWIRPEPFVALARDRASMKAVPRISSDIALPANVSLLLDLCNGN